MRTNVDGLEKERDFYFGKLRDIEVICQEEGNAGTSLSERVLQILYATEVRCFAGRWFIFGLFFMHFNLLVAK